ncbi:MAG TPA: endonuclease III [Candidatus Kapabacteria bacterium]|nr:endonuclease III [Candidatus Kapabacteria bacterium]HPU23509.1 endonuclease III [Candidatus Kapabacteria bacterium]
MAKILDILAKEYPNVKIQLNFSNPFELLIATILSAQCTDERVNKVTPSLFKKYKSPSDYVNIPIEELEKEIYSTGYYKAKAKHIKEMSKMLLEKYNGVVPSQLEELIKLPGVGRKTANVVLGHCFNVPAIVVDTHVIKLSNRLGFVCTKNAEIIERKLMELIPKNKWVIFTHYFISHGRKICTARNPKCNECVISKYCKYYLENIKN